MRNTLFDWLAYIEGMHHSAIDLGLSRVEAVADQLALRHFDCPVILIGGTNGKGTCVACLDSIYKSAGYTVATYTSPHLIDFNERICINGQMISDNQLIEAFEAIDHMRQSLAITLSFFEFTTLAALWIFKQIKPNVILLEVGLGGRLDATNIVAHDLAIVTSIAMDHMDWLGNTREAIAYEKTGIARANKLLICGDEDPPEKLETFVLTRGATLALIGRDFSYDFLHSQLTWRSGSTHYEVQVPMQFKPQNIATALMGILHMQSLLPVSESDMKMGVSRCLLPGRFELLNEKIPFILDVAHNPAATAWLATQLKTQFPEKKITAVFGVMKDKSIDEMIAPLLPVISNWCVVDLSVNRASSALTLSTILSRHNVKKCYNFSSVSTALDTIVDGHLSENSVLVFGSFYTVSDAKKWITKNSHALKIGDKKEW